MKIATWNINSIRLRKENVINFLKKKILIFYVCKKLKQLMNSFLLLFYNYGYVHAYIRGKNHIMVWQYYQRFLLKINPFIIL